MSAGCSSSDCLATRRNEGSGMELMLGVGEARDDGDKKRPLLSRD
jgi:hypothetical protein